MSLDYSKWDSLAAEGDSEVQKEKLRVREENKSKYYKEQAEKQIKWNEKQQKDKKEREAKGITEERKEIVMDQNHNHSHSHSHSHDHDHLHDHSHHEVESKSLPSSPSPTPSPSPSSSTLSPSPSPPSKSKPQSNPLRGCGCGFLSPEALESLKEQYESNPDSFDTSSETHQNERKSVNHKKLIAVRSVREHGKELILKKDYKTALDVYDRGLVIIAGAYDMDSSHQDEMNELEAIFNLNISICKFNQKEYRECISSCKSCLQLSPKNIKAMYRYALALVEMGEYGEAEEWVAKILQLESGNKDAVSVRKDIERRKEEEKKKDMEFSKKMSQKLAIKGMGEDEEVGGK